MAQCVLGPSPWGTISTKGGWAQFSGWAEAREHARDCVPLGPMAVLMLAWVPGALKHSSTFRQTPVFKGFLHCKARESTPGDNLAFWFFHLPPI